ncbi:Oidioi.mRNA.OKI2018_I69.chr1.g167.t1.cds [Oikopleura dioica]|uniref:Oidioi.mRNA.OKI2018_I69.chr1.g167.t1.cds n=1 Tax=Oikopleura dioica TaxID=34765 RepID=A0ABN7SMU5_OIKDI|nr:Oidioi.mRNA.OKI2018_I69.chr1.g167.t1.cds [Oikopleura dioica]
MRIALFGATGATGAHFLRLALEKDHEVVALVRSPEKIKIENPKLKIVKCNIFDQTDLAQHLANSDAVVSCLGGFPKNPETKMTDGYSRSIGPITGAMRTQNITRILVMGSWYNNNNGSDAGSGLGGYFLRFFLSSIIGRVLEDMKRMRESLRKDASDLAWTMVNPPGLTNGPLTDRKMEYEVGDRMDSRKDKGVQRVSRADVAKFMLETVEQPLEPSSDMYQAQIAIG